MEINSSPTLVKYRDVMRQCLMLYYPESSPEVLDAAIDYSIQKRIQNANAVLSNSYRRRRVIERDENGNEVQVYKNAEQNLTLQQISDYILFTSAPRKAYILCASSPTTQILFLGISSKSKDRIFCCNLFVSWYSSTRMYLNSEA